MYCSPRARRLSTSAPITPRDIQAVFIRPGSFSAFVTRYKRALDRPIDDDDWSIHSEDDDDAASSASSGGQFAASVNRQYVSQIQHFRLKYGEKIATSDNPLFAPPVFAPGRRRSASYSGPYYIRPDLPRIPLEIIERIIEYCALDDNPGPVLSAFASTCRVLYRTSIRHLYGHVILYSATGYSRLVSSLQSNRILAQHVDTLQLGLSPFQDPSRDGADSHGWLSQVPIHLPLLLPQLKSIVLHEFPILHPSFFPLVRQFTSIVTLHVWKSFLPSTHTDLARLLWALPALQHAVFEGLTHLKNAVQPPAMWKHRRRVAPPLRTLAFRDCGLLWEEWMLTIEMKTLETLVLVGAPVFPYDDPGAAYKEPGLLASSHDTLKELTILLKLRENTKDPLIHLGQSLTNHTCLRELNIGIRAIPPLADLNTLLAGLSTEVLEIFTLMFDLRHFPHLKDEQWSRLDNTLCNAKFQRLHTVAFIATDQQTIYGSLRASFWAVRTRMPKLNARGVLQIIPTDKCDIDLRIESFLIPAKLRARVTATQLDDDVGAEEPPQPLFERISDRTSSVSQPVYAGEVLSSPWNIIRSRRMYG